MNESYISPFRAGLTTRCPRCGEGKLFSGYLEVASGCDACGLDYSHVNSGDGPAVFIILIMGAVTVTLALLVEVWFSPPLWLHAVLWAPFILGGSLALLRPFKATMIALQFRYAASQDVDVE